MMGRGPMQSAWMLVGLELSDDLAAFYALQTLFKHCVSPLAVKTWAELGSRYTVEELLASRARPAAVPPLRSPGYIYECGGAEGTHEWAVAEEHAGVKVECERRHPGTVRARTDRRDPSLAPRPTTLCASAWCRRRRRGG